MMFNKKMFSLLVILGVASAQGMEQDPTQIKGAYENLIMKAHIINEKDRADIRGVVCHGGDNPRGTTLVGENLAKNNLFFHETKAKDLHLTLAVVEPKDQNSVVLNTDYYNFIKDSFIDKKNNSLEDSYGAHVNHNGGNLNGIWMFVNGYNKNGEKVNKHYSHVDFAKYNIEQDFMQGNYCCAAVVHYVVRFGTSQTKKCDGKAGPLTKDVNKMKEGINDLHESNLLINPQYGIHDEYLGHMTIGIAKVEKGKITEQSKHFTKDQLKVLVDGYKEIQDCFESKNANIKNENEKIKAKNDRNRQNFKGKAANFKEIPYLNAVDVNRDIKVGNITVEAKMYNGKDQNGKQKYITQMF